MWQKHAQALPTLAVELAQRTAYALGLEHRHLYRTSSYVLDEAITLPDPPDGFYTLTHFKSVPVELLGCPSITAPKAGLTWMDSICDVLPEGGTPHEVSAGYPKNRKERCETALQAA